MFDTLTLKGKFVTLQLVSFVMFLALTVFCLIQLNAAIKHETDSLVELQDDIRVMGNVDSMSIIFLKEVKLAKDVWIRGVNPEKIAKYRGEFIEQQNVFNERLASALAGVKKMPSDEPGVAYSINALNQLSEEHKTVSSKYLAQIDAHKGNAAESDAAVAGIDRELSRQINALRDGYEQSVNKNSADKITLSNGEFQQRRNIVFALVLVSLLLSVFLAVIIIRSVLSQLGCDPKDVAKVINVMASVDFSQQAYKSAAAGSLLANAYAMQSSLR